MQLLKGKEAARIVGVAPCTLKEYRRKGKEEGDRRWLKQDIHYVIRSPTVVRYIKEAIEHWALNDEETHNQWIKAQATSDRGKPQRSA